MYYRSVQVWLIIGVVMILFQIVIGGITRLTGSGLSITKWEIVTGTLPPTSDEAWNDAFDLYKATPQYKKINKGMSLNQFKFIFFWEYIHRLWARSIGFVFLIPFLIFIRKKFLSKILIKRLLYAVVLGAIVAAFGWIMVKSGLVNRPWVNAYKLVLHLGLGVLLFTYLLYIASDYWLSSRFKARVFETTKRTIKLLLALVFIQILFGGLMSGMRAGLFYPSWPLIGTEWIPADLFQGENWNWERFRDYDQDSFAPAVVHVFHRTLAYIIAIFYFVVAFREMNNKYIIWGLFILLLQIIVGIITVLKCIGEIPVFWGAVHQLIGILFFGYLFFVYLVKTKTENAIQASSSVSS